VMALAQRGKHERVCRRAVKHEEHVALAFENCVEPETRLRRKRIVAIAGNAAFVCRLQRVQRLRTNSGGVIAGKSIVGGRAHRNVFGNR
jgi:hypothetical protein